MRTLLIIAALVVVSSTAFADLRNVSGSLSLAPDTLTEYPSRIDTLRFDRINGVWKPITDTVWAKKIQVWLTPDQYKKLLELLAPPKDWWRNIDTIPISRIQCDTVNWIGDVGVTH